MRVLKSLAALAAVALLCGPALAADKPEPEDPQKVAAARAQADAAITQLGVGDYFVNASEGEMARVRHKGSRMTCMLPDDPADFHIVFGPDGPRGDDVTCQSKLLGAETQRAVRTPNAPPLQGLLTQAVRSLGNEVDGMKPYRGTSVSATSELAKDMKLATARFTGRQNGQPVYARVSVFVIGDWVYTQKVVAPKEMGEAADLIAEIELVMEIIEMVKPDGSL